MTKDLGLGFEYTIRKFLGNKAHGIAGCEQDDTLFRQLLRDVTPIVRNRIKLLDTTSRHKEMLLNDTEKLHDLLKSKGGGTEKQIITRLYSLVARLFGFDCIDGIVRHQLFYYQTLAQHCWEKGNADGNGSADVSREHWRNVYSLQREVYVGMKKKGLSDQVIAGVLNTTEHQIKRLKHKI